MSGQPAYKKVTVRVWEPTSSNVGHASLQTYSDRNNGQTTAIITEGVLRATRVVDSGGVYASFWPESGWQGAPVLGRMHALDEDRKCEGGQIDGYIHKELTGGHPDYAIDLYGLDIEAINAAYRKFEAAGAQWDALGSSAFFGKANTSNCSGLVSNLLYEGGMRKRRWQNATYSRLMGFLHVLALLCYNLLYGGLWQFTSSAIGGMMIANFVGGFLDGLCDTRALLQLAPRARYVVNASCGLQVLSALSTSSCCRPFLMALGGLFGGMASCLFITNAVQYAAITPSHISMLAKGAAKKDDIQQLASTNHAHND